MRVVVMVMGDDVIRVVVTVMGDDVMRVVEVMVEMVVTMASK